MQKPKNGTRVIASVFRGVVAMETQHWVRERERERERQRGREEIKRQSKRKIFGH